MSSRRSLRFAQHYIECWHCGTNAKYYCKDCSKKFCEDCRFTHYEETNHTVVSFHEELNAENETKEDKKSLNADSDGKDNKDHHPTTDEDEAVGQTTKHEKPYNVVKLEKSSSCMIPSENCLQHIANSSSETLWVSDGESIFCVEINGKIKCELNCGVDWGCHTVTETGKLLYLKGNKIKQYNPATKKKTLLIRLKGTPNCISICPRSGNIIVGVIKNTSENERGIVLSLNENGDSVWKQNMSHISRYIANDAEGNIYISQSGNINGSVLALGMDGHCRFLYKGDMEKHGFMPLGICADKPGLVFVINASQRNIHVIDKEGTLSLVLRTDCSFLHFGISMNNEGCIWTCSGNDILQWKVPEEDLQLNIFEEFNQRDVSNKKKVHL